MLINLHTHNSRGSSIEILNFTVGGNTNLPYSIGVHPYESDLKSVKKHLRSDLISHKNCFAIGEIGLDKLKGPTLEIQKKTFIEQIEISESVELPVIIHCVRAWNEIREIKKNMHPQQTWIFHGFTKVSLIEEVLSEGIMISIGSAILMNKKLQERISSISDDRLFLETDNDSVPISSIYKKVAELKNISLPKLEQIIENNFKRVFQK